MSNPRLAEKLLAKADQDLQIVNKCKSDPDIAEEIIGFHAQQAAEKILKAVLSYEECEYPFTHRLSDLIDLLKDHDISFPDELEEVRFLTPFAVEFRYEVYLEEEESTDFEMIHKQLRDLKAWARAIILSK